MSPADHNKTLVIIYLLLGGIFTLPLIASPWIIAKNIGKYTSPRGGDQVLITILIAAVVVILATLFWSTALGLYRRKSWGRKVALVSAVISFFLVPPLAAYAWWFLHSDGAKRMYGESDKEGRAAPRSGREP
jgi:O-antigen/teichoic acid export membrane protein